MNLSIVHESSRDFWGGHWSTEDLFDVIDESGVQNTKQFSLPETLGEEVHCDRKIPRHDIGDPELHWSSTSCLGILRPQPTLLCYSGMFAQKGFSVKALSFFSDKWQSIVAVMYEWTSGRNSTVYDEDDPARQTRLVDQPVSLINQSPFKLQRVFPWAYLKLRRQESNTNRLSIEANRITTFLPSETTSETTENFFFFFKKSEKLKRDSGWNTGTDTMNPWLILLAREWTRLLSVRQAPSW